MLYDVNSFKRSYRFWRQSQISAGTVYSNLYCFKVQNPMTQWQWHQVQYSTPQVQINYIRHQRQFTVNVTRRFAIANSLLAIVGNGACFDNHHRLVLYGSTSIWYKQPKILATLVAIKVMHAYYSQTLFRKLNHCNACKQASKCLSNKLTLVRDTFCFCVTDQLNTNLSSGKWYVHSVYYILLLTGDILTCQSVWCHCVCVCAISTIMRMPMSSAQIGRDSSK